jgi:hypothetical protein
LKKLDFIVCGVQKAGTSTLHALLGTHPGIALPDKKELHFFDSAMVDWRAPDYRPYHAHFGAADPARLWGESTPVYLFRPEVLPRIRAYRADIKLIVVFRDPVDRAYSHWCMNIASGLETLPFAEAVREDGRARAGSGNASDFNRFSYVERGFYGAQLQRLLSLFPRSNVLALDFERIRSGQAALFADVCDFLGLPRPAEAPPQMHRLRRPALQYPPAPTPADRRYLEEIFAADAQTFATLSGFSTQRAA